MIVAKGINSAWLQVMSELFYKGKESAPRGHKIKELKSLTVKIENPKLRVLTLPLRKISLPFAFGELVWYLSGRNDVGMMEYYSKKMRSFSDDGHTLNSAYGYRMFGNHPLLPFDQWAQAVHLLKADPDSRQAVIHLHTPNNKPTKDEVCTLSLQFMIRDGKLDMYTTMRSNDIIWGFTYDVFSFTTFQELMANELGVEVGDYYHTANSMHIYEKDFKLLGEVMDLYKELMYMTLYDREFGYSGLTRYDDDWAKLEEVESYLRTDSTEFDYSVDIKNPALNIMEEIFWIYRDYKRNGKEIALERLQYDSLQHCLMRNYMERDSLEDSHMLIVEGPDGAGKTTFIDSLVDDEFNRTTALAFGKPGKDFDPFIYFHTALLPGSYALDRFFYSELVYGRVLRGSSIISNSDQKVLEKLLNYRGAKLMLMVTDPAICYDRLDDLDKMIFTFEDIKRLHDAYTIILRAGDMQFLPFEETK